MEMEKIEFQNLAHFLVHFYVIYNSLIQSFILICI
jgi:hypothetical protein